MTKRLTQCVFGILCPVIPAVSKQTAVAALHGPESTPLAHKVAIEIRRQTPSTVDVPRAGAFRVIDELDSTVTPSLDIRLS